MATKTLDELEVLESKAIGDHYDMTCSADGAADGSTLISSSLLRYPSQSFRGFTVEITSGARDGDKRVCKTNEISDSTATLTPYNAFGGQIVDAVTFRLHRIPPEEKLQAIDEVLRGLGRVVPLILTEDIISGELLRNGHFEFWRTPAIPFDWEIIAGTVARESTIVYQGQYALSLTGTGTAGSLRMRIPLEYELAGVTVELSGWAYGTANAAVLIKIEQGSDSDSDPLAVTDTWTELEAELELDNNEVNQPIYVTIQNTTAGAIKFDALSLRVPSTNTIYVLPLSQAYKNVRQILQGPSAGTTQSYADYFGSRSVRMPDVVGPDYLFYTKGRYLANGYYHRLIGVGQWPTLADGTDEVELTENEAQYVACRAAVRAIHRAKAIEIMSDPDFWNRVEADLARDIQTLERSVRKTAPPIKINPWRV